MRTRYAFMRTPYMLFLLPVFFVLHGFTENFRHIPFSDCIPLMAWYALGAFIVFVLLTALYRNKAKGALLSWFILFMYFFFGSIHHYLLIKGIWLHRYLLILPLFLTAGTGLAIWIKKRKDVYRPLLFLNTLVLLCILSDLVTLAWKTAKGADAGRVTVSGAGIQFRPCQDCDNPDIYFLIFDEYENSAILKSEYGYDNSQLDSFLIRQGFHIQAHSRSNYQYTPFSMSSIFNMSYLQLRDGYDIRGEDYLDALETDVNTPVLQFLTSRGYTFVNHSSFDVAGHPSMAGQGFITTRLKLITSRTMENYLYRDMGQAMRIFFKQVAGVTREDYTSTFRNNNLFLASTIEESRKDRTAPKFVYMHVFMPHNPHLFDSLMQPRPLEYVDTGDELQHTRQYLGYLPYTNSRAQEVISAIKENTRGKAVIIFMSDHGIRYSPVGHGTNPFCFDNQNAIYLPDGNYASFPDSLHAVNEFRVVFNRLFGQSIPLLKDSTIILRERSF